MIFKVNLNRWWLLINQLFLVFLVCSSAFGAQSVHKLLILDSQEGEPYQTARKALLAQLDKYGYVVGKNLQTTYYSIENDKDTGKKILSAELSNHYDVIFVNGTIMAIAAKEIAFAQDKYHFVYTCVTDPVGIGLIDDFDNSPKANFTGVSFPIPVQSRFKFILQLMPNIKNIGLIYADMPQSQSYRQWIDTLLKQEDEFKGIKVLYRTVPLITGEMGNAQMTEVAKKYVAELDSLVDIFISPNDQLGATPPFAQMVYKNATKPLIGLGLKDVVEHWGATMAIYPSQESAGQQAAFMIKSLFEGQSIKTLIPQWPKQNGFAFDLKKAKQFGIKIPIQMIELAGENIVK